MIKQITSYHGSKKALFPYLRDLIPRDADNFCEPFCGSAVMSVNLDFRSYLLNDRGKLIYNLFCILRDRRKEFIELCRLTPCDSETFRLAKERLTSKDDMHRAWAFFTTMNYSFARTGKQFVGYYLSAHGRTSAGFGHTTGNKLDFLESDRFKQFIRKATVVNKDACKFIKFLGQKNPKTYSMFIYCDPPYVDTHMGGYEGDYSLEDFKNLLETLKDVKNHKWMLSCFSNPLVESYKEKYNWFKKSFSLPQRVSTNKKEECVYTNYKMEVVNSLL